jgi:hypothetical protein
MIDHTCNPSTWGRGLRQRIMRQGYTVRLQARLDYIARSCLKTETKTHKKKNKTKKELFLIHRKISQISLNNNTFNNYITTGNYES